MIAQRCVLAVLLAIGLTAPAQAHGPGVPSEPELLDRYRAGLAAYQKQDYASALTEWQPVAEHGSSAAQLFLGFMAANGLGLAEDAAAAVEWYRRAAEQDNMLAQIRLAMMYRRGHGVGQDPVKAHHWASLAARDQKHLQKVATAFRKALQAKMTAAQIAEAEDLTRAWLDKHKKGD
jgi:TPR repeat protein